MGISILSRLAAEDEISAGRLLAFPLGSRGGKRSINVVYEKNGSLTREAEKFIATVKEMFIDNVYK